MSTQTGHRGKFAPQSAAGPTTTVVVMNDRSLHDPLTSPVTLDRLVPRAASIDPDADAVIGTSRRLSYADLDRETASVASFLIGRGVTPGNRVAVGFNKDTEAYVAMHGVLRAGAVAVPLDAFAGAVIAQSTLADAGVDAILGLGSLVDRLDPGSIEDLDLRAVATDETWSDVLATAPVPLPVVHPDDPAYLIYTSGSTGAPKGILHSHRSAMAYVERAVEARRLTSADRVAGISAFTVDMSTFELYGAPYAGAAVVVMSEAHLRMPASFVQRSSAEAVTIWYAVPALLRPVLVRGGLSAESLRSLRLIMFAGEPYPAGPLAELMAALPHVGFENVYGPAEVNECTRHVLEGPPSGDRGVPIGHPWRGVDVVVMDDDRAVPPGEAGELWVSAPTLMEGYWHRPDLDAGCLVRRHDGRPSWYRTGDIVVADESGLLWFLGRRDHQIKVRGHRIELEQVENVLAAAPGVIHAVAGSDDPGNDQASLVAAVVVDESVAPSDRELRQWCGARLPAAAVPRAILRRSSMPLNASGKIDRRAVRGEITQATSHPTESDQPKASL